MVGIGAGRKGMVEIGAGRKGMVGIDRVGEDLAIVCVAVSCCQWIVGLLNKSTYAANRWRAHHPSCYIVTPLVMHYTDC